MDLEKETQQKSIAFLNVFKDLKKVQIILLIVLILTTVFFRFWKIRDYVVFLGDEGRDMIIMRQMIQTVRPVFLGPTASVGGFYLGPIYYWMAAPFLALTFFDPVGPSIMVAIFGFATVLLLYKFLKETIGFYPAILASFLYATSPLIVRYSRSSWNPNPLPFFALLLIYSIHLAISRKKPLYFLLTGASFGVAVQLHYLSIMLIPIAFLIILINIKIKSIPKIFFLCALGAIITFSPFLIFELKHNFPNFRTIMEFVTRPTTHGYTGYNLIGLVANYGNIFFENLSGLKGTAVTRLVLWTITLVNFYAFFKNFKDEKKKLIYSISILWLFGGLLFIKFYAGQIYDYYYGFIFPAPFLAFAVLTSVFWQNIILKVSAIAFTAICMIWFIGNSFYTQNPNRLINQTETVAKFLVDKSAGKPFNFGLISDHNSDHAYRYFLDIYGHKPTELETLITDQLLVVCESQKCAPLGHPSWEIAGFGRAEIESEWQLPDIGIRVFKLKHWPGAPNPAGKPAVKG